MDYKSIQMLNLLIINLVSSNETVSQKKKRLATKWETHYIANTSLKVETQAGSKDKVL